MRPPLPPPRPRPAHSAHPLAPVRCTSKGGQYRRYVAVPRVGGYTARLMYERHIATVTDANCIATLAEQRAGCDLSGLPSTHAHACLAPRLQAA
eukprot:2707883-Rhodomonas_salina.1